MKIVAINSSNFGSTGKIMLGIAEEARKKGIEYYTVCPKGRSMRKINSKYHFYIGNRVSRNLHILFGKYTGFQGCGSIIDTLIFIKKLNRIKPDIIHLHNLHDSYINLPLLFKYIKKRNIYIVWTLHDCWAFTGKCPHFTLISCEKWKKGCFKCPQYKQYPLSKIDNTKIMWKLKKKLFNNINKMIIVTPSQWLSMLVKESFLKNYTVKIINNGINLLVFRPRESDFSFKNRLDSKYIILGVAFGWDEKKGLDVFIELSKRLESQYQIVLVGTNNDIDNRLPKNIISLHRTHDQNELAEIYSSASLFVNPTREDNYPTVNMEALACGTPVVTFKTGGSPEILDSTCGSVIECENIDELEKEIRWICENNIYSKEACLKKSKCFDERKRYEDYIKLYKELF